MQWYYTRTEVDMTVLSRPAIFVLAVAYVESKRPIRTRSITRWRQPSRLLIQLLTLWLGLLSTIGAMHIAPT